MRMGICEGISHSRPDRELTMYGCERIDERQRGMFYRGPMVDAKCSYPNPKLWHLRADMVEWGPELHTSAWIDTFDRRGDLQNKELWCSSKNMSEKSKASICLSKVRMSKRERHCVKCCIYSSWAWLSVLVCKGYCSLYR